jgi:4-amino-4-deoxy-L-arabinose transferase-like glycosyltransferase
MRPYLMLLGLCLLLYLPGQCSIPAVDRDEARFVQASRQMLEDGDFVRIRFQNEPRHKKPVGIYWLQAASVAAAGTLHTDSLWPYRLPSVAGAVLAVMLTFSFGRRWFGETDAFLGAGFLAASVLLVVEAHLAKTDAVQLAAACAAQGALGTVYLAHRRGDPARWTSPLAFWIAMGIGILIKGPVLPMVSLLTVVALCAADRQVRWLKRLRPAAGLLLTALIVTPWMISIYRATGGTFFTDAVGGDLLPKLVGGQESHGAPPGTYLVLVFATFWPGSLFVWPALSRGFPLRQKPEVRFLLAWLIPTWIAFELIPTKLPHYVLPLYPALALLAGNLVSDADSGTLLKTKPALANRIVWVVVTLALVGLILSVSPLMRGKVAPVSLIPAAAGLLTAAAGWRLLRRFRPRRAAGAVLVGAVLVLGPTFSAVFPNVTPLWLSRQTAKTVEALAGSGAVPVSAAAGYHEPSLVFHLGTRTLLTDAAGAAAFLAPGGCRFAIVADSVRETFVENAQKMRLPVVERAAVTGFNYTKGHWVTLHIFTRKPDAANSGTGGSPPGQAGAGPSDPCIETPDMRIYGLSSFR